MLANNDLGSEQCGVNYSQYAANETALTDEDIINLNTYDFMAHLGKRVINPGGLRGRDQLLANLQPQPGTHLLEIGCGSGHAACHIARKYKCQVTAIDISPRMIEEARQVVREQGMEDQVHCQVADIVDLPFGRDYFDNVMCQAVLMFVDQRQALSEVKRVLKSSGTFAGLEFCWKKQPPHEVRSATYQVCGCTTLEFHSSDQWAGQLREADLDEVSSSEHPFRLLSIPGFLKDEGLVNSIRISNKIVRSRANIKRMCEIWSHFSTNINYFSYTVLSSRKRHK
jgi:ubiquinone/menaquinone biosynthesis C-methylase UbiE